MRAVGRRRGRRQVWSLKVSVNVGRSGGRGTMRCMSEDPRKRLRQLAERRQRQQ
jgi:hypothetical protein